MKKKILSFLLMMLPAVLLTSCLKDQEDLFSDSASQRVANYLDKAKILDKCRERLGAGLFPS